MADGNGPLVQAVVQIDGREMGISDLFPYLLDYNKGTPIIASASGACDPSMGDVKERLSPFRHSLAAFRGTIATNGADLTVAPQTITLFNVGVGDDAVPTGLGAGFLTRAETNAQSKGGLVQQGQQFVTVGYWVQTGLPATIEGALRSGVEAARLAQAAAK